MLGQSNRPKHRNTLTVSTRHINTDRFPFDQLVEVVDSPENGQDFADEHILAANPAEGVFLHFPGSQSNYCATAAEAEVSNATSTTAKGGVSAAAIAIIPRWWRFMFNSTRDSRPLATHSTLLN